ncbi:MAG: endopeptidase La [Planctomycetaceae bacterium]|nr:endopeptidase La [Planctomycetaceae bacterium]
MSETPEPLVLPLVPVRNTVLYPYVVIPISIGRPLSVAAVEAALAREDKMLAIVAQKDVSAEVPSRESLFDIGTMAVIKRMARSETSIELIIQGLDRVKLDELIQTQPYLTARVTRLPVPAADGTEAEALQRELLDMAERIQGIVEPPNRIDFSEVFAQLDDPMQMVYMLATMVQLSFEQSQRLLEAGTRVDAMRLLHEYLTHETKVLQLRKEIATQASEEISQEQREYLLRRQLKAIQDELGEQSPEQAEVVELRKRLEEAELPEEVRKETERNLNRLENLPSAAPDYQVLRTHTDLVLELPWAKLTQDNLDLVNARRILDEDHYGLKEVKERILEFLAVMKLNPEAKAPILCFVGPPGVGKTSLGQSIARSLGRKFERFSLGGLHDEAELRGHRRTYIGAMPGRIIQAIRRAGVRNPMLMLDELDKLGRDFRGDPAAALLEVLDPAQNSTFRDNYLDLPFDLSKVFFVTTANSLDPVPRPLLDRMEVIRLTGYSDEEKLQIALKYLIPRQRKEAGLSELQVILPDETLLAIIQRYTREAGLREFERMLARVCRKVALRFAEGRTDPMTVRPEDLSELLGPERFFQEHFRTKQTPGVATGLAWTEAGGDVLFIEALRLPDGGGLTLTGQLGDVMQESARAAQSYILSHAQALGIESTKGGVHLHVPAGAIPKDGPSAGVTMATALASAYSGEPVRNDTAMTGEITLTGLVLPVGGIREKVLAARRAGIRRVILPAENRKDLRDIPDDVREEMQFLFAEQVEQVLSAAIPSLQDKFLSAIS